MSYSTFNMFQKEYELEITDLVCNKFGFAEFFVSNYNAFLSHLPKSGNVLDLGCGVGPFSLFFSSQNFNVTAIDLNPIAITLCKNNSKKYNFNINALEEDFSHANFKDKFDIIISNPPIYFQYKPKDMDDVTNKLKNKLIDKDVFSFLTNSWLDEDGEDLIDHMFRKSHFLLNQSGIVIIICGDIGINCKQFVLKKAEKYKLNFIDGLSKYISAESVGLPKSSTPLLAHILAFNLKREQ